MTTTETVQAETDRKLRHEAFDDWVATVRDPANANSEGIRTIRTTDGKALAEYEIAPLPDGRFALHYGVTYRCGDCRGRGVPWTAYSTREDCVAEFLKEAREHFAGPIGEVSGQEVSDGHSKQREVQQKMLQLLEGDGLFGFLEPEPVKNE